MDPTSLHGHLEAHVVAKDSCNCCIWPFKRRRKQHQGHEVTVTSDDKIKRIEVVFSNSVSSADSPMTPPSEINHAISKRKQQESSLQEHTSGDGSGKATETGSGDCAISGT